MHRIRKSDPSPRKMRLRKNRVKKFRILFSAIYLYQYFSKVSYFR